MRRIVLFVCGASALAAVVACATSDDEGSSLLPRDDAGSTSVPEAAAAADGGGIRDAGGPTISWCSDAGWCATSLPDPDLRVTDIWPFDERAFAIAESDTLGTKVLEWTESTESWAYIDDNSQNAYGGGQYAGKIWAPSEDEIYYGVAPARVYHGTRTAPSSPWTWESSELAYDGPDAGPDRDPGRPWYRKFLVAQHFASLGVWGTSRDDVYAWYGNTIFHKKSVDGGAPEWVAEYVADDPDAPDDAFFVFGADGSSADDVWFVGGRGHYNAESTGIDPCPMIVRRAPDGYRRILDYRVSGTTCQPKAGALHFFLDVEIPGFGRFTIPWTQPGWTTSVASTRPGAIASILDSTHLGFVDSTDAGSARLNTVGARSAGPAFSPLLGSIWIHGDKAWMSGWGLVLDVENKPDAWAASLGVHPPGKPPASEEGASYTISTTALNGAPIDTMLLQVRGSSNTNLWAVGSRYALHKKTP